MNKGLVLELDKNSKTLVKQLVDMFTQGIKDKKWPTDAKLPSVRRCAELYKVSTFTVTETYNRLAAAGLIYAKDRSGYFIAPSQPPQEQILAEPTIIDLPIDDYWLLTNIFEQTNKYTHFSCGWVPADWYPQEEIAKALREVAKQNIAQSGYGEPYGYNPLREQLRHHLADHMIHVTTKNILITQGASSALDIISNTFLRPGETVLVDDPGYCNFLSSLQYKRMKLVGVPWTSQGPDIEALEEIMRREKPRFYFTNPWLQNPTGASLSLDNAYKLLRLAEKYNVKIIEDNVSGDLMPQNSVTLVSMAGLDQVIHIGSFCKTLQPNLRVGYVVATQEILEKLVHYKMMTSLTSSEISERVVLSMLRNGHYRKHIEKLRGRLAQAHAVTTDLLTSLGWELFAQSDSSYYLYARPKNSHMDSEKLTELAKNQGLLLAHGRLFSPTHQPSAWVRFNVAYTMLGQNILKRFLLSIEDENILDLPKQ